MADRTHRYALANNVTRLTGCIYIFCDCLAQLIKAVVIKYNGLYIKIRVIDHMWSADWPDCKDRTYFSVVLSFSETKKEGIAFIWIEFTLTPILFKDTAFLLLPTIEIWRGRKTWLYCLRSILIERSQSTSMGNVNILTEKAHSLSPPHCST